ncbi:MAG: hypothetical protein J5819_08870 [Eubacterium sp.]|nr:hypothetical protein [Eubacterium sp.]
MAFVRTAIARFLRDGLTPLEIWEVIIMSAFDRIESGIPEMDTALDNIRLGDTETDVSVKNYFLYKLTNQLVYDPYLKQRRFSHS